MNILVISDTHRHTRPVLDLLRLYEKQINAAVHLGDYANDLLLFRHEFPHIPFYAVSGNCDYGLMDEVYSFSVNGRKIVLTHGHNQGVKMSCDRLVYWAEEQEAHACLFGHTHAPNLFEVGAITFINPGSLTQPRMGGKPTYGLLKISDEGVIKAVILDYAPMKGL